MMVQPELGAAVDRLAGGHLIRRVTPSNPIHPELESNGKSVPIRGMSIATGILRHSVVIPAADCTTVVFSSAWKDVHGGKMEMTICPGQILGKDSSQARGLFAAPYRVYSSSN